MPVVAENIIDSEGVNILKRRSNREYSDQLWAGIVSDNWAKDKLSFSEEQQAKKRRLHRKKHGVPQKVLANF